MNSFQNIIARIDSAEDAASKASTELQRAREELVEQFSPVQVGVITSWPHEFGTDVQVRVTNVQVAKSGTHGHKFVATGNILTNDGVETANRIAHEWPISEEMAAKSPAPAARKQDRGGAARNKAKK